MRFAAFGGSHTAETLEDIFWSMGSLNSKMEYCQYAVTSKCLQEKFSPRSLFPLYALTTPPSLSADASQGCL